jgi:hypothetical protein
MSTNLLDQATMYLSQANGVLSLIAEAEPTAPDLETGQVAQAIYAAIDQINRSVEAINAHHQRDMPHE